MFYRLQLSKYALVGLLASWPAFGKAITLHPLTHFLYALEQPGFSLSVEQRERCLLSDSTHATSHALGMICLEAVQQL